MDFKVNELIQGTIKGKILKKEDINELIKQGNIKTTGQEKDLKNELTYVPWFP